jgi:hypothetical protein
MVSGLPIPSFMQFQPLFLKFIIFQKREILPGIYQLKLVGSIKSHGLIDFSFFNITIKNKEKLGAEVPKLVYQQ